MLWYYASVMLNIRNNAPPPYSVQNKRKSAYNKIDENIRMPYARHATIALWNQCTVKCWENSKVGNENWWLYSIPQQNYSGGYTSNPLQIHYPLNESKFFTKRLRTVFPQGGADVATVDEGKSWRIPSSKHYGEETSAWSKANTHPGDFKV